MRLIASLGIVLAVSATACDSFEIGGAKHATLTYTQDARAAYNEAMESFKKKEWEDAKSLFEEVRQRFSYSQYAKLAELRLADIQFEQEKFSDAIQSYREFLQNHRNDRDSEYARYRICKALFRDIDDTIFLPSAEERDQATTLEAFKEIKEFNKLYPRSRYADDIAYMREVILGRLARHELYVARYYARTDDFEATILRIDYALKNYPGSGLDAEALVLKGETLMKMKRVADARDVFERVKREYGAPFGTTAQSFLDEIERQKQQPKK